MELFSHASLRFAYKHLVSLISDALLECGVACDSFELPSGHDRDVLYSAWQRWIKQIGGASETPIKILLLLDEFQRWIAGLEDSRDRRALMNVFRDFNDTNTTSKIEVSFVLFGLQNLKRFSTESLDFAAAVRLFEVRPFNLEETRKYIDQCLLHAHDDSVRRRLYVLSGGNPFILNLLCKSVVNAANQDGRSYCVLTDVDKSVRDLDERIENVFRYMLREDEEEEAPTLPQLTVLRAVASRLCEIDDLSGWVDQSEVEDWLQRKKVAFDEGMPSEHIRELVDVGILDQHPDKQRVALPGEAICRWLARRDETQTPLQAVTRRLDVNLVLNRYRQLEELGRGGQATVWLAENVEEGGHKVALKIYPGINEEVRDRIKREGEALARIDSLYVVRCLGHRIDERKGGVVILEWVNGRRLSELLEERPVAAKQILSGAEPQDQVNLLKKLTDAVHAVHRAGVVHKDLKPANIMMLEEGGVWRPKIIDFGLAMPDTPTDEARFTESMWTWRYLAPEKQKDPYISRRRPSDIYSLGVVFLDVLVGRCDERLTDILDGQKERLGLKMYSLISDMLSEDPDERPTAEQVLGRLAGVLEPEGWEEMRERADEEFLREKYDTALRYYHRAIAEASKCDVKKKKFADMLSDVLECVRQVAEPIDWWQMLTQKSLEACELLNQEEYWNNLIEVGLEKSCFAGAKANSSSAVLEILSVVGADTVAWGPPLRGLGEALAKTNFPFEMAESQFSVLVRAFSAQMARPEAIADFCARQAQRSRGCNQPLVLVENWLRRGRRFVPGKTELLQAEFTTFEKLQQHSHSTADLPPDAVYQDRKVIGEDERGHTEVERIELFAGRLLDAYPWIQAIKRVRGDSALQYTVPSLLDDTNIGRHEIPGIPNERLIPFVLDGNYTKFKGCIRMNIVLPEKTTKAQKRAAREVLSADKVHFP